MSISNCNKIYTEIINSRSINDKIVNPVTSRYISPFKETGIKLLKECEENAKKLKNKELFFIQYKNNSCYKDSFYTSIFLNKHFYIDKTLLYRDVSKINYINGIPCNNDILNIKKIQFFLQKIRISFLNPTTPILTHIDSFLTKAFQHYCKNNNYVKEFTPGLQNDPELIARFLFDDLFPPFENDKGKYQIISYICQDIDLKKKKKIKVETYNFNFNFQISNEYLLKFNQTTNTYEKYPHTTLLNVYDLLQNMKLYSVFNFIRSSDGKVYNGKIDITKIIKYPKLLFLKIERFNFNHIYNSQPIFPSPILNNNLCLYSIICQTSTNTRSNHYISFIKYNNRWLYYDDMSGIYKTIGSFENLINNKEYFDLIFTKSVLLCYEYSQILPSINIDKLQNRIKNRLKKIVKSPSIDLSLSLSL